MKKSTIFSQFNAQETLTAAQSLHVKGGDDKHPPLGLPGTPPPVRTNAGTQNAQGNNNNQQ